MIQLMRKSPTKAYIDKNLHKCKLRYKGLRYKVTKCTWNELYNCTNYTFPIVFISQGLCFFVCNLNDALKNQSFYMTIVYFCFYFF